jgi:hypothetical protein
MPDQPGYLMWFNNSPTSDDSNDAMEMLRAIDQEIIRVKTRNPNATVAEQWAYFPSVPGEPRVAKCCVSCA